MQLPQAKAIQYKEELRKMETGPMKYISSVEQLGRDKQLQLVDDLLDFKHFDDLEAWLAHHVNPL